MTEVKGNCVWFFVLIYIVLYYPIIFDMMELKEVIKLSV